MPSSRRSSQPRHRTHVSYISCIDKQALYHQHHLGSQSLLGFIFIKSVMISNHLILCRPLLILPSIFPSIRVFSNESAVRTRWPKYWSFSFSISPSNEYSGLISLNIDWFDLLAVQGTLKSLFQHHNLKASILRQSAFSMDQLSTYSLKDSHSDELCVFPWKQSPSYRKVPYSEVQHMTVK